MSDKAALTGSLSFISLADIFQILGGNNSTGVLRITSQYTPNAGIIYFVNGDPINAANGPLNGIDAIYALFGWSEGNFEFQRQEVGIARTVKNNRMEIVLDALRMLDDGQIEKVGPPSFEEKDEKVTTLPVIKGPLVDYAHVVGEEDYSDGSRIVKEGGHGNWIWVILNGIVEVTRETSNRPPVTISRLGEGCFVGTFSTLSFRDNVRPSTVRAIGDVQLGLLETERLSMEYTSLSPDFKGFLISLDGRLRKVTDRVVELFLKQDKMKGIISDKKLFMKKGTPEEKMFTILEGEICVLGHPHESKLPLLVLQKEDVFGYVPFIDIGHEPRSASIFASQDLKVESLDIKNLQSQYENLSGTFKNMIYNIGTCIFVTTKRAYELYEGS